MATLWRFESSSGHQLEYRALRKEKVLALGPYPERTLADARDLRDEARKRVRDGGDPSAERKLEGASSRSVLATQAKSFQSTPGSVALIDG